jgi:hypothetical protein
MSEHRKVKVAVGCTGHNGPDLFFVVVDCTQEQYDNGEHYEAAQGIVMENNYVGGPYWCVDENDPAKAVLTLCADWNQAETTMV